MKRECLLLLLMSAAGIDASAQVLFANFSSATAGTLNGVAFTVDYSVVPGSSRSMSTMDLSGSNFNPPGTTTQPVLQYSVGQAVTITFAEQISGLSLYLGYWRGGGSFGPSDGTYDLSATPTLVSGVNYSTSGNSIIVSSAANAYASGTVTFLNPLTTLTITPHSGGTGSSQNFTLAAVPEPAEAVLVSGLSLVGFAFFRQRMLRKQTNPAP